MPQARVLPRAPLIIALVLLLVGGVTAFQLLRPLPAVAASVTLPASGVVAGQAAAIPWPAKGGAALSLSTTGLIAASGETAPKPMASVTKIMTALVLLDDKPLKSLEQGPLVPVDAAAVADYNTRQAGGESVVRVAAGEQLSEYQALQGLLLPSGNNLADLVARWDAGTVAAFVARMNARARALHLTQTTYADTSGISPQSVSTPSDLVVLAQVAAANPVIAEITAMPQAELPVAGVVYNVDHLVGQDGIFGVKTGSSPDANANFVFASKQQVDGKPVVIFGAVMGQDLLDDAFAATIRLIDAVKTHLVVATPLQKGQKVGRYHAPWGSDADVIATADVTVVTWPGTPVTHTLKLPAAVAEQPSGAAAGTVQVTVGTAASQVPAVTNAALVKPGARYRLTRLA